MATVTIIRTDGKTETHALPADEKLVLAQLQSWVGGYIEPVPLPDPDTIMLVNEEGLLHGLSPNDKASFFALRPIVGDVVVMSRADFK